MVGIGPGKSMVIILSKVPIEYYKKLKENGIKSDSSGLWRKLWQLKISPKVKNLIWRVPWVVYPPILNYRGSILRSRKIACWYKLHIQYTKLLTLVLVCGWTIVEEVVVYAQSLLSQW